MAREEVEPAGTKFSKDDYVRIVRGGPYYERLAQVVKVWYHDKPGIRQISPIFHKVETIDNKRCVIVDRLRSYEIKSVNLNAMQILALQARPDPPQEGIEGHEQGSQL